MSLDWVPGVGVAVAGSLLALWRGSAVMEEKVKDLRERVDTFKHSQERLEESVHEELAAALEKLNNTVNSFQVMAAEQTGINRLSTKTLESLVAKLEQLDERVRVHDRDIAVMKAGRD